VSLGSADAVQRAVFDYPAAVARESTWCVIHSRDALVFRNLSDTGAAIGPAVVAQITRWVRGRTASGACARSFGGPIKLLPNGRCAGPDRGGQSAACAKRCHRPRE
jgi:hypothetical protein